MGADQPELAYPCGTLRLRLCWQINQAAAQTEGKRCGTAPGCTTKPSRPPGEGGHVQTAHREQGPAGLSLQPGCADAEYPVQDGRALGHVLCFSGA